VLAWLVPALSSRHEQLREEGRHIESCARLASEAVESLIRIQEK
jgi:hypothetical protein